MKFFCGIVGTTETDTTCGVGTDGVGMTEILLICAYGWMAAVCAGAICAWDAALNPV